VRRLPEPNSVHMMRDGVGGLAAIGRSYGAISGERLNTHSPGASDEGRAMATTKPIRGVALSFILALLPCFTELVFIIT
jgi:hypothetical protein